MKPEDVDELLKAFADTTEIFKRQPGFISAQLHSGTGKSTFFNDVLWESVKDFKQAFDRPEFQSKMSEFLPNVMLYNVVSSVQESCSPRYLCRVVIHFIFYGSYLLQ